MSLIPEDAGEEQGKPQENGQVPEETTGRPDFVELQFWDADKGEVRLKEMAQALSDTQTKLRNNKDDMRKEIEDELKKGRPESPAGYKVEKLDIPEDSGFEIPEGNKLIEDFRQFAYDAGLTGEQFTKAVSIYAQALIDDIPNQEKEIEALGENAQNRIGSLVHKARTTLNEEEFDTFKGMVMTAKDVQVLEKLMRDNRPGPSDFDRAEPQSRDLEQELDRVMTSQEYLRGERYANERALELSQQLARSRGRA